MPLIIAVILVAAQTLVVFHSVAHQKAISLGGERSAGERSVSKYLASQHVASDCAAASPGVHQAVSSRAAFWAALFGHAADSTENAALCVAWDAAFAAAVAVDTGAEQAELVVYNSAALPLPATLSPALADLLGIALARAPPRT